MRDTCYFIATLHHSLEVSVLVGLIDNMVLCTIAATAETSFLLSNKRYIWPFSVSNPDWDGILPLLCAYN